MSQFDPLLAVDAAQPQTTAAATASEEQFRAALDHALDGMVLIDNDGRFIHINHALYMLFGLPDDALLGRTVFDVQRARQLNALSHIWTSLMEQGYYRGELSIPRDDVGNWDIEITAVANILPDRHLVVLRDITARKRDAAALSASEERFATAFRASPDAMSISELFTGRIIDVNDHWMEMIGYSREEAVGHLLPDLALWTGPTSYDQLLTRLRNQGFIRELEVVFQGKSGEARNGLLSVELIALDGALCALAIQRDITARKQTEEALRASEERFATAFRASPYMVDISRLDDGRVIDVNAVWEQISGYSRQEALGQTTTELGLWPDAEEQARLLTQLREQGTVRDMEVSFRARSGNLHRVNISSSIIDLQGDPCLLRIGIDITARTQAEAALRASEERFAKAFRATPDAISITQIRDGMIVDVNDSWLRMGNYQRDAVIGRSMLDLNIWHDPAERDHLIARLYAQGSVRDFEMLFKLPNGELRQGIVSAELLDLAGEPCLLVLTRDVTEQKQAAAQLRLLGAAVQHASEAITLISTPPGPTSPHVVFVNPAFTRLTGYSPDEVLAQYPNLLQGPETAPTGIAQIYAQLADGQPTQGEVIQHRKDGSEYLAEWYITPVHNEADTITHWMLIQRDITGRRAMEARVRAAERLGALGRVAAGVAHEFNNILAGIMGRLDLLESEIHEPGPQATLHVIQRAVEDGANVVRRIQAFSRLRAASVLAPVALSEVIAEAIALTQPRWKLLPVAKGVVLTLHEQVEPGLGVLGDATELREVITNLIHNAVEAMPDGGQLTINAARQDTQVVLTVGDTGIGMDVATQERAFEPFFTTKVAGTGLGLLVVQDIIEHHGGTIGVASVPGQGTTFTVTLPAVAAPPPPPPLAPPAPVPAVAPAAGIARILVVDDDPSLCLMLQQMMALAGHEVRMATSGIEALALVDQYPFDLVCTDLGMPGMDGWELARAVRQRAPDMPIALITGWGIALDPSDIERNAVDFVLPKPYRAVQINQLIAQTLARQKELLLNG